MSKSELGARSAEADRTLDRIRTVFGRTVFGPTVFGSTVFGPTVFGPTVFGSYSGIGSMNRTKTAAPPPKKKPRLLNNASHRPLHGASIPSNSPFYCDSNNLRETSISDYQKIAREEAGCHWYFWGIPDREKPQSFVDSVYLGLELSMIFCKCFFSASN
jgi:hypothetical protein